MNIGLLVSELEDSDVKRICIGASQAAKEKEVSLVIMPGGYLPSEKGVESAIPDSYQHTAIFDYANSSTFDALLIDIERIGKGATILKKESFLNKFDKTPVLTLSEQEGYQAVNSIQTDHDQLEQLGYEAICDAISYAESKTLTPPAQAQHFSFVEESVEKAALVISNICYDLFRNKYESESAYRFFTQKACVYGINNCGIYIFDQKIKNTLKYNWTFPDTISIKSAVIDGKELEDKTIVETSEVFSDFLNKKPKVLVAGSVFVGDYQLGLLVSEFSALTLIDNYYRELISTITAVSRMSYLEKELEKTTEELYDVQEELARDDSVLDHIGDQDYLTGGLNRRGFFAKAYDLLKEKFRPGKYAVVAYIHMESLKKINELFGHDEGDRAVKKIASILEDVFGDSIYGRIRGDEFAVIEITDEEDKAEALRQEMSTQNARILAESNRYINNLQYSICEFGYEDNMSLREMLKETDESLQRIKGNI